MKYEEAKQKLIQITVKLTGNSDYLDFGSDQVINLMKILVVVPKPLAKLIFRKFESELTKKIKNEGCVLD